MRNLGTLAEELNNIQQGLNQGRGHSAARTIVNYLRQGDLKRAKATVRNEADKFECNSKLQAWIVVNLFEKGEDHPWSVLLALRGMEYTTDE